MTRNLYSGSARISGLIEEMELLKACISKQVNIDEMSLKSILSKFETVEIKKGDYLLHSGKICRRMTFIASGYMRMYNIVDGKEVTFWIGSSGKFITSLSSFVFQTANYRNI